MKTAKATETGAIKIVPMKNINPIRARITKCPAIIFAKSRIARAKGFVNNPRISTGIMSGSNHIGIPCGTKPLKYPKNPLCLIPPS